MPVYFCNSEPIDLNAIAIMGVSVKTRDNPIGFFGTGLKFSIATLLREGHEVTLIRDGKEIDFSVRQEVIRGELFDRICMGDEVLGFTTKLGRNWECWQAYRELHCNCTDEGGVISDACPEGQWGTIFKVVGEGIEKCHRSRHEIFIQTKPMFIHYGCEIHPGNGQTGFYRGVKATELSRHAVMRYNVTDELDLTEDRTVKHPTLFQNAVERAIASCDDESIVEAAIMAPQHSYEDSLDYSGVYSKPSLAFMDVAFRCRHNGHANRGAIKLWEKHSDVRLTYTEVSLDRYEEETLDAALALVRRLGAEITRQDFIVVDGLGERVFGVVRGSQILIAKRAFDMGHRFVASTLYEEWLHKVERLKDESRDLQNLLFEKLFSMVERVRALETIEREAA